MSRHREESEAIPESKDENVKSSLSGLLDGNGLKYKVPESLTLTNMRMQVSYPAQSSSYTQSNTIQISLANNDYFVNAKNSYLYFDYSFTEAGSYTATWGKGSAANLISRTIFTHGTGQSLCNNNNVNLRCMVNDQIHRPNRWFNTVGAMQGYAVNSTDYVNGGDSKMTPGTTYTFAIPLGSICSVFDTKKLIPPFAMSGSRVQFSLETGLNAMVMSNTLGAPVYTVSNCRMMLDCCLLSDAAFSALEKISAADGTDFVYNDYINTTAILNSNNFALEQTSSIGRARDLIVIPRTTLNLGTALIDNFAGVAQSGGITQYQTQLNSIYLPIQPVSDVNEMYQYALQGAWEHGDSQITPAKYKGTQQIIYQSLLRSEFLGISSGLPINASTPLRFRGTVYNGALLTLDLFVTNMKLAVLYLFDKVIIEA